MKKLLTFSLVFALTLSLGYGVALAGKGNELPPGPRYVLNVHAYDNCPQGNFEGSNRHMIAVQADYTYDPEGIDKNSIIKTNTISLTNSDNCPESVCGGKDFVVLDGNACGSKGGAEFALPSNPYECPEDDNECLNSDPEFQEYRVFVRLVGKKQTGIDVKTCADEAIDVDGDDVADDIIMCSTESVVKVRTTGKGSMRFEDVSRELLTICLDTDDNGSCDTRYALFDPALEDYFWQWNTTGQAKAQLVFVPIPD